MPIFNLCIKILKKNTPVMMIYFGIFIMVSLLITQNSFPSPDGFFESQTNIILIMEEETPLLIGLRDELSKIVNYIDIEDEPDSLQDALFFRKVNYILRIPAGFTEVFLAGDEAVMEKTVVPNAANNIYIDMKIEQYLNLARLYVNQMPNIEEETLRAYVMEDMAVNTNVEFKTNASRDGEQNRMAFYFNYLAYTFMFVVILGVSTIMLVFNNMDIKRRNACAPIGANKINFQFILANSIFALGSWVILVIFCLLFDSKGILKTNTLYHILNSFIFALCASGISFLIGNLVKGREGISAVANIVTLGSCFISGVFVPQSLLGERVLRIASFLPTYWYVKANDRISELTQFSRANLLDVTNYLLIELGFAFAFFIIAMVVGKRKWLSLEES